MGLTVCFGRGGTVLNYLIAPPIYESTHSLAFAFWVGTLLCQISLVAALLSVLVDQGVENKSGVAVVPAVQL